MPGTSGGSTHTLEVASNLAELGNEVLVCSFLTSPSGPIGKPEEDIGRLRIVRTDFGKSPFQPLTGRFEFIKFYARSLTILMVLSKLVRRYRIDLIYQRSSHYDFAGTLAGLLLQRPVILEVHDPLKTRFSLRWADRIVVVGSKSVLGGDLGNDRIVEVSNCCNVSMFSPSVDGSEVRGRYGWNDRDFVVVYTGGFYPWHGLEDLVEAAEALKEKLPYARYLLVGDGPTFAKTQVLVKTHGLQDIFVLTGRVPYREVPKYLAAANIAIAPYDSRKNPYTKRLGFFFSPIKLLEYMAAGKPIITTSEEGISTMIEDGRTGLLVEHGRPDEIAKALALLASNSSFAKTLGLNAREIAVERYSWEKLASNLNSLFLEVRRAYPTKASTFAGITSALHLSLRGLRDIVLNTLHLIARAKKG